MRTLTTTLRSTAIAAAAALAASAALAGPAPTMTAEGLALGFSLTTVVSGIGGNHSSYGVLGSSINSDGNIIVNDGRNRMNYVFKNIDGQTVGDALSSASFNGFASSFAYSSGYVWATANGGLTRLNNDGSVGQVFNNISASQGMWTNPSNGHLITGNPLYDVDVSNPNAPTQRLITSSFSADGLTVSPDGKLAYSSYGGIYDIATGASVGNFGNVGGADGMGVITSSNALNGDIVVSTTNGRIVLVDSVTFEQTVLATGGGYGDYVSPDYSTGTLFVSSSTNLLRLSCGVGCGVGAPPPPPPVPEPETYAMMLFGLGALAVLRRRRQH